MDSKRSRFRWCLWTLILFGGISLTWVGCSLGTIPTQLRLSTLRHNDRSMVPYAQSHLKSDEPAVRSAAAKGLGTIGPAAKAAVPDLIVMLRTESPEVASNAAWALGNIEFRSPDPAVIQALIEGMDHEDGEVGRYSAYGLSLCGPRAATATFALIANLDDPHMGYMAARALGEIGPSVRESIPQMTLQLKSTSTAARAETAMALSKLQPLPEETVSAIEALLDDPDPLVRDFAKKALNAIPGSRASSATKSSEKP